MVEYQLRPLAPGLSLSASSSGSSTLAAEILERAFDGEEDQDEARGRGRRVDGSSEAVEEIQQAVTGLSDFVIRKERAKETLPTLILYSAMRLQEVASHGQRSRDESKTAASILGEENAQLAGIIPKQRRQLEEARKLVVWLTETAVGVNERLALARKAAELYRQIKNYIPEHSLRDERRGSRRSVVHSTRAVFWHVGQCRSRHELYEMRWRTLESHDSG